MEDTTNVGESERKHKDLGSDSKERAVFVGSDEDEQIPSIFSCRHPTGVIGDNRCFESELKETKHRIFLSHNGQQKDFVEQLCVDLEKMGYLFPFFDQRSHSLPEGKDFSPLILEAAKSCHVAVIVLSETFLTSKWPMIELVTFYEAWKGENPGLKLVPLFYKLSIDDLKNQSNINRWMCKWREYESADSKRISAKKWEEAVKSLVKLNGFIFEQSETQQTQKSTGVTYRSEVEYRGAIEREILKTSPPNFLFGSSKAVVGFDRLCKTLSSRFVEDTTTGLLLLGLYGMPGLGKTTMLEALCDYFCKLGMKVCYVDLDDSSKTQVERQKVVLKKLCEYDHEALRDLYNVNEGWNLMKEYLGRDGKKMQRFPVVLAIDNVTVDSRNEARAYVEAGFCPGSRIMFTSRSKAIVKELLSDERFCKPVPDLTIEEAETIILKTGYPRTNPCTLTDAQKRFLGLCVEQCRFSRDEGGYLYDSQKQYHPFALKALANCLWASGINQKSWEEDHIKEFDRDARPDLFKIIERQFKGLNPIKQLFFLDAAVFGVEWVKSALNRRRGIFVHTIDDWVYWLAGLHMAEEEVVKKNLEQLERFGMIKLPEVTMHQLYKEFAVWFVTKENPLSLDEGRARKRIRIVNFNRRIPRGEVGQWKSLVLLQLISCNELKELNLDRLDCLRHLELRDLKNLEKLVLPSENDSMQFMWLSGLDSLKRLDIGFCCTSLQVVVIARCSNLRGPLGIEGCSELRTLSTDIHLYQLRDIRLGESLRDLYLTSFPGGGSGMGVELNLEDLRFCSQLRRLTLAGLLAERVQGLEQVTGLDELNLSECCLEEAPEISPRIEVHMNDSCQHWHHWAEKAEFCDQLARLTNCGERLSRNLSVQLQILSNRVTRRDKYEKWPRIRFEDLTPRPLTLCSIKSVALVRTESGQTGYDFSERAISQLGHINPPFPWHKERKIPKVHAKDLIFDCEFCSQIHLGSWTRPDNLPRNPFPSPGWFQTSSR